MIGLANKIDRSIRFAGVFFRCLSMFLISGQKAFTLIELMITIAVVSIVLVIAAPAMDRTIINNKSVSVATDFVGALNFARAEALKRNNFVTLCPRNTTNDGCGTDWAKGWLIVRDTAASQADTPVVANEAAILRRFELSTDKSEYVFTPARDYIRFASLGVLGGASAVSLKLSVSHCTGTAARTITVSPTGMIRIAQEPC